MGFENVGSFQLVCVWVILGNFDSVSWEVLMILSFKVFKYKFNYYNIEFMKVFNKVQVCYGYLVFSGFEYVNSC